ncbi:MAG: PQQ-dependent sugar dehydrogenase [Alphaproteobacteria bacterium]|nr:PQQ-dependent sugar dehydrogenase [Alphaproteobacteria bacterium]
MRPTLAAACLLILSACAAAARGPSPGERFHVDPATLPDPGQGRGASNPPQVVPRPEGVAPQVPEGFRVTLFAEGLEHARWLAVAPDGDVFLAESRPGRVTLLRDADGDGRAEFRAVFAEDFRMPHGLAVHGDALWVADLDHVWRLPRQPGQTRQSARIAVTRPGALGDRSGHWTRNLAIHPDGDRFYVAIGSRGNLREEPEPRATVQEFRIDGSGQRTFAAGLRNPVGIAFRPGGAELWTVVNERDNMGDSLVPDYLTRLTEGDFYGWPYAWLGRPQPGFADRRPDLVAASKMPDLLFRAHSAPLGLTFAANSAFPEEMRDDAFVALHGSWNSREPVGYAVVRVPFRDGRPEGDYTVFAGGFWLRGDDRARVWGRPVGLAFAKDGALLVADDAGQTVWHIAWQGR